MVIQEALALWGRRKATQEREIQGELISTGMGNRGPIPLETLGDGIETSLEPPLMKGDKGGVLIL